MNYLKLFLVVIGCGGCSLWQNTQGPLVPDGALAVNGIVLVERRPPQSCVYKGGILNDIDAQLDSMPESVLSLNAHTRRGLAAGAKRLKGNVVWVLTTRWQDPEVSNDYLTDFVVNNVTCYARVYACPDHTALPFD